MNMKKNNEIHSFTIAKGIKPYIESEEYVVFHKNDIFDLIDLIKKQANIVILGGDIWIKEDDIFYVIYDNWYCEATECSIAESILHTLEYLNNYPFNDNHYISLSFKSG